MYGYVCSLGSSRIPPKRGMRDELIDRLPRRLVQWNLHLTKCQETREVGSFLRGFFISRFCSIHFKRPDGRILFVIIHQISEQISRQMEAI